jgi:hypothetical protein
MINIETGLVFVPKVLQASLTYLAASITSNYMSQVYIDKVLVNQENPPGLHNFVLLFVFLNFILMIISSVIVYIIMVMFLPENVRSVVGTNILVDYITSTIITMLFGLMVTHTMQNKKFFLYKDDGLRAIRALKEIMTMTNVCTSLIPFHLLRR